MGISATGTNFDSLLKSVKKDALGVAVEVAAAALAPKIRKQIAKVRAKGGSEAVIKEVRHLLTISKGKYRDALLIVMNELLPEEKKALSRPKANAKKTSKSPKSATKSSHQATPKHAASSGDDSDGE